DTLSLHDALPILPCLKEGQAHNGRMGADEPADEQRSAALNGVAARLSLPFATIEIEGHLLRRQPLEGDARFRQTVACTRCGDEAYSGIDAVGTAREKRQAAARFLCRFGFRENAPPASDNRVGPKHHRIGICSGNRLCLLARKAARMEKWQFTL